MKISRIVLSLAVLAAALLLVAGPGSRFGLWEFRSGFMLLRVAFFGGLGAAALALVLIIIPKTRTGNAAVLVVAMLLGLATAWVPWNGYRTARSLPFIHDISTDTVNPPPFVAIVPLRADASNPHEYAGAEVAQQQLEGYPDIRPLMLDMPPGAALRKVLEVAEKMNLDIVAVEPGEGRLEATATTFWFGFQDDVVVRVTANGDGSRVDVRSKSRVGRSDVGANAARIRRFVSLLQD